MKSSRYPLSQAESLVRPSIVHVSAIGGVRLVRAPSPYCLKPREGKLNVSHTGPTLGI